MTVDQLIQCLSEYPGYYQVEVDNPSESLGQIYHGSKIEGMRLRQNFTRVVVALELPSSFGE